MKKYILYIWCFSISLIALPLYMGFPDAFNGEFILKNHSTVKHVSEIYYLFAKVFQALSILGILIFVFGFLLLQKESGFQPSLIITSIESGFFMKLYQEIKNDINLILIIIVDFIVMSYGILTNW